MMRPLFLALLLANTVFAQERTWTITTAVVTADAELVGVRGDVVYLKMGDKIESVPLERLSVADHEYLASVSLAPVRSVPGSSEAENSVLEGQGTTTVPYLMPAQPVIEEEDIPLPPNVAQPTASPQIAGSGSPRSANGGQAAAVPRGNYQPATSANTAASAQRRGAATPNPTTVRRVVTPPSNQSQSGARGNANSDEPSGILGIFGRRSNRQRGR